MFPFYFIFFGGGVNEGYQGADLWPRMEITKDLKVDL